MNFFHSANLIHLIIKSRVYISEFIFTIIFVLLWFSCGSGVDQVWRTFWILTWKFIPTLKNQGGIHTRTVTGCSQVGCWAKKYFKSHNKSDFGYQIFFKKQIMKNLSVEKITVQLLGSVICTFVESKINKTEISKPEKRFRRPKVWNNFDGKYLLYLIRGSKLAGNVTLCYIFLYVYIFLSFLFHLFGRVKKLNCHLHLQKINELFITLVYCAL